MTFHITVSRVPADARIFITGDDDELGNWKANAVPLDHQPDGSWAKTVMLPAGKSFDFKITRGHWRTEALDSTGPQNRAMQHLTVVHDTTVSVEFSKWMDIDGGTTSITAKDIENSNGFGLAYGWRYHGGDNPSWSAAAFNDSAWEIVMSHLDANNMPTSSWTGIGWFRMNLEVDSSLWNKPLALNLKEAGAAEVYLDGKLLYRFGNIERFFGDRKDIPENRNPNLFSFGPKPHHVIAIRYASERDELPADAIALGCVNGFHTWVEDWGSSLRSARTADVRQVAFTAILGTLAFIHLILFVFYPKFRENLFYSLSTIGVVSIWVSNNLFVYIVGEKQLILLRYISQVSQFVAVVFGILLVYSLTREKLPRRWKVYVAVGAALAFWSISYENLIYLSLTDAYTFIAMIEIGWLVIAALKKDSLISYVFVLGFLILVASIIYGILASFIDLLSIHDWNNEYIYGFTALGVAKWNGEYIYGFTALGVVMSIFLSYRFSSTNKNLEIQLGQVHELSERALSQEREARENEIERRLLTADNDRKTEELEEARSLQLSMLPKSVPKLANLDIAVRMQTATEVGGDYYDFFVSEDGVLTAVIGDATGHGLKAGSMVIAAKGLVNVLIPRTGTAGMEEHLDEILKSSNRAIKNMNLHMLTMCLAMVRISNNKIEYSSAGMPPLMVYRKKTRIVEQLILKAMPLGAFHDFPYARIEAEVYKGDILLIISDGMLESFNENQEAFGIERMMECLKGTSDKSADNVISHLFDEIKIWSGGAALMDDMTAMAIKIAR